MTMTVRATYVGGVLRPVEPLPLAEGETIDVTIARSQTMGPSRRSPTPEEEDYARRLKAAQSLEEMYAVMATAPPSLEDTYDVADAINESRRLTGFRLPAPPTAEEAPQ
jgi:predicted DNA-binding antitoxin AbrB/MazE fold protein